MNILGLVEIPWWLLLLCVGLYLYHLLTANHHVWRVRGVPGPPPRPLVGTMLPFFKQGIVAFDKAMLQRYGRLTGLFEGAQPALLVHDAPMLKEIMVKQFDCFVNRRNVAGLEGALKDMLTVIRDGQWRKVRNHITPSFTSGKLRGMYPVVRDCAAKLKQKFIEGAEKSGQFDIRKIGGCYTMDVIAYTAFGIDAGCMDDPENEFIQKTNKFFQSGFKNAIILLVFLAPKILPVLKALGLSKYIQNPDFQDAELFFRNITEQVIREREEHPDPARVDFVRLCLEANKETVDAEKRLTTDEIHSQAMLFFIAGYETTNTTISFMAYNLATHPEVQDRLCAEIDDIFGDKEQVDYESLQKMPYFEQCLEETLRLYSPATRVERTCNRDTVVCGVPIRKDELIIIPLPSLQRNPEVFPDPDHFDPERFSPEAKEKRDAFNWLAFGMGPRNCIGMRLALLEIRVAMVTVLRTHRFVKVKDTVRQEDITWLMSGNLIPNERIILGLEKRK